MPFNFEEGEIILINKPYKWTSFDVVNYIRNTLKHLAGIKKIKIGHAGTLDPLATGLLIICTGRKTKQIEQFKEFDKEYTGTFTLGAVRPTYDLESEISEVNSCDHVNEKLILLTASSLTGNYLQKPPLFSAVKIKGKRAYEYARRDQEVVLEPKPVSVPVFEITGMTLPDVAFRIICSKGTYIRAIARDFGERLGCGAYLSSLCRTRIGPYFLKDAMEPEEFKKLL